MPNKVKKITTTRTTIQKKRQKREGANTPGLKLLLCIWFIPIQIPRSGTNGGWNWFCPQIIGRYKGRKGNGKKRSGSTKEP